MTDCTQEVLRRYEARLIQASVHHEGTLRLDFKSNMNLAKVLSGQSLVQGGTAAARVCHPTVRY